MKALRAGAAYFAAIFAAGFVLGTIRVLFLVPRLGELAAVALEIPLMLALAWWICGRIIAWLAVPSRTVDRAGMGAAALMLLWGGETLLALSFGTSLRDIPEGLATAPGALGLVGQLGFAAFPLVRHRGA